MRSLSLCSPASALCAGAFASLLLTPARPAQATTTCKRGHDLHSYREMVDDFTHSMTGVSNDEQKSKALFIYLQTCANSWLSYLPDAAKEFPGTYTKFREPHLACGPVTGTKRKLQPFESRAVTHQNVSQGRTAAEVHLVNARAIPTGAIDLHVQAHVFTVPKTAFGEHHPVSLFESYAAAEGDAQRAPPATTRDHLEISLAPEEGLSQEVKAQANNQEICPVRMLNKVNQRDLATSHHQQRQFYSASRSIFLDPITARAGELWSYKTSQTFNFGAPTEDRNVTIKRMEREEVRKTIAVSKYVRTLQKHLKQAYKNDFPNMVYDEYAYLLQENHAAVPTHGEHLCAMYNKCGLFEGKETHGAVFREYLFAHNAWLIPGFSVNTYWMDVAPQLALKAELQVMPPEARKAFVKKYVEDAAVNFARLHLMTGLTLVGGYHGQNAIWELVPKEGGHGVTVDRFNTKAYFLDFGDGGIIPGTRESLKAADLIHTQMSQEEWTAFTTGTNAAPSSRAFVPEEITHAWYEGAALHEGDWVGIDYAKATAESDYKRAYEAAWKQIVTHVTTHAPAESSLGAYLAAHARDFYHAAYDGAVLR